MITLTVSGPRSTNFRQAPETSFVAHSQGGMAGTDIAANGRYNVKELHTFGTGPYRSGDVPNSVRLE